MRSLRVVTYNIHKSRGMDRRVSPLRIAHVLAELDADIIALQEVLRLDDDHPAHDQAAYLATHLKMKHLAFGNNRIHRGAEYGNAVLSRYPILASENSNITVRGREPRGCLRCDIDLRSTVLHLFNVHLGTGLIERRSQGPKLLGDAILGHKELTGPRILLGDFNEWTRGKTTQALTKMFQSAQLHPTRKRSRSYPGLLPVLHLDHIYFDPALELIDFKLHRSRTALIASDHLPLYADFRL